MAPPSPPPMPFTRARFTHRLLIALAAAGLAACGPGADAAFDPCTDGPLTWRIAEVDPRFGIGVPELERMVTAAAAMWEEPAGRPLFRHDPERGMPIRLVYDERQARTEARRDADRRLERLGIEIERRRLVHERDVREAEWAATRLEADARRLRDEVRAHNRSIERANRRGAASAAGRRALEADARRIERMRAELERAEADLAARQRPLRAEAEAIQRRIEEHNALAETLNRDASTATTAGLYHEQTTRRGRRTVGRERSVTIYQMESDAHLTILLAHEMGHALGLGHVGEPRAIMHETHDSRALPRAAHASDLAALEAACRG